MKRGRPSPPGSLTSVIQAYRLSDKFLKLAPATRASYDYGFRIAEKVIGDIPAADIRPSIMQEFFDQFSDRPATQKNVRSGFVALNKFGLVRDLFARSITESTQAPGGDGSHEPWDDEHVRLAELHARPDLARLVTLAANTGQRGSDLVKMRWQDVEDYSGRQGINVTQQKTGKVLWVPFTRELITAIADWERRPGFIVLKPSGSPYTRQQLSDTWKTHRDGNAALEPLTKADLTFHGLRATAVIRLRRAGVSKPLIADFVGMSVQMVDRYCRRSEQKDNALAALAQMQGQEQAPNNVVEFAPKKGA